MDQIYLRLTHAARIDLVGPFPTEKDACDFGQKLRKLIGRGPGWSVSKRALGSTLGMTVQNPKNPVGLANCCAPTGFDWWEARCWAEKNYQQFMEGTS